MQIKSLGSAKKGQTPERIARSDQTNQRVRWNRAANPRLAWKPNTSLPALPAGDESALPVLYPDKKGKRTRAVAILWRKFDAVETTRDLKRLDLETALAVNQLKDVRYGLEHGGGIAYETQKMERRIRCWATRFGWRNYYAESVLAQCLGDFEVHRRATIPDFGHRSISVTPG